MPLVDTLDDVCTRSATRDDVGFDFETSARHPDRVSHPFLPVDDVAARTTWMISRSLGTDTRARRRSPGSRLRADLHVERATSMTPRLFWLRTWVPAMPTNADSTLWPHIRCGGVDRVADPAGRFFSM